MKRTLITLVGLLLLVTLVSGETLDVDVDWDLWYDDDAGNCHMELEVEDESFEKSWDLDTYYNNRVRGRDNMVDVEYTCQECADCPEWPEHVVCPEHPVCPAITVPAANCVCPDITFPEIPACPSCVLPDQDFTKIFEGYEEKSLKDVGLGAVMGIVVAAVGFYFYLQNTGKGGGSKPSSSPTPGRKGGLPSTR